MAPRSKKTARNQAAKSSKAQIDEAIASSKGTADKAMRGTQAAGSAMEDSVNAAGKSAATFNRKCIDIAKANMEASFELATALAAARSPLDAMQLQAEFMRNQYDQMGKQSRELAALAGDVARGAGNPFVDLLGTTMAQFGRK